MYTLNSSQRSIIIYSQLTYTVALVDMIGFKSVQLLKDQTLGVGSYGRVCKAKCDQLTCAAKIIHETLFNPAAQNEIADNESLSKPVRRFEQECEFMRSIRHPNIVQYLGLYEDPATGLPSLLMELMDENLNHFLDRHLQPLSPILQLKLCHDVALALVFLHSNGIVHRDLSGNNVLLLGSIRAKVSDFGMAHLSELNLQSAQSTLSKYPGSDAYMPPEYIREHPMYSGKFDCFSFGVITLQILTRQFPKPGDRHKTIEITDARFPSGTIRVVVNEVKRRENHISLIDPSHPVRPIILQCLRDKHVNRPSAQDLCDKIKSLKEDLTSTHQTSSNSKPGFAHVGDIEKDKEERISDLQKQLQHLKMQYEQLLDQKDEIIAAREMQIQHFREQMDTSVTNESKLYHKFMIPPTAPRRRTFNNSSIRTSLNLKWRKGIVAPSVMYRSCDTVVSGSTVYFKAAHGRDVYSYHLEYGWSHLPNCPSTSCTLVVINNMLTAVGLIDADGSYSNKLLSLAKRGNSRIWTEMFPPMPSKRSNVLAVSADSILVLIGGTGKRGMVGTVEVLNTDGYRWSSAADMPSRLDSASGAICNGFLFVMSTLRYNNAVFACSLSDLLQSCQNKLEGVRHYEMQASWMDQTASVWRRIADPPVFQSTCISLQGQLLAVGGQITKLHSEVGACATSNIYKYNTSTNTWSIADHIPASVGRFACFVAVLHKNQLIVVGGLSDELTALDTVELANTE